MTHNVNDFIIPAKLIPRVCHDSSGALFQIAINPDDANHIWIVKLVKLDLTSDDDLHLLRDIDPDWTSKMK